MTVLDVLRPSSGGVRRLGALVDRVQDTGHPDAEPLSVYLERGVVRRSEQSDNHNVLGSDLAKYQRVLPGDLVFNRLRTWQGGFGASRHAGIVSPAYIVLRPRDADAQYLDYMLHSAPYLAELTRLSKWMPPSQFDILWTDLRSVPIPQVPLYEQQRIVDFLDDQVARIDRIIAARREQVVLAREEFRSVLEARFWQRPDSIPLKHLLADITSGPRGWGDLVGDVGTPFVRIGNLSSLGIELNEQNLVKVAVPEDAEAVRAALSPGDVLLSITAAFGEVAVWRRGEGTFSQHVARLRPLDGADSDWIAWALQSPSVHDQYRLQAYGGTKIGMGLDQVRNLQVPNCEASRRRAVVTALTHEWERTSAAERALTRSIDLLAEYKSSLITAAVTGELDVTTAGSGIPA